MDCSNFSSSSVRVRFFCATVVGFALISLCPKVLGRDMVAIGEVSDWWDEYVCWNVGEAVKYGVACLLRALRAQQALH